AEMRWPQKCSQGGRALACGERQHNRTRRPEARPTSQSACRGGEAVQPSFIGSIYRRRVLKFLAGSPLLVLSGPAWLEDRLAAAGTTGEVPRSPIIASPSEAINLFDFEAAARER